MRGLSLPQFLKLRTSMFPLRIPTHLSGTSPRYQNSTCGELELYYSSIVSGLYFFCSIPPLSEYLQTCEGYNTGQVMVLRKGPNITHGDKNFRDVQGTGAGPDFPGKLITQCQHRWGLNIPCVLQGTSLCRKRRPARQMYNLK